MFKQYDTVESKRTLNNAVPIGSLGAVLMVFTDKYNQKFYEVEFVDEKGVTLDILTVAEVDLSLKQSWKQK